MAAMTSNIRSRDFANGISLSSADGDRSSQASTNWASHIWNDRPNPFALASAGRDSVRTRENSTHAGAASDMAEAKTGSSSLLADSDTEWRPTRLPWGSEYSGTNSYARSSGVSPARKQSLPHAQPLQQFSDLPASFYPVSRGSMAAQGGLSNPAKPLLDPTSNNFTASRAVDSLNAGFSNFGFGQSEAGQQRPDTGVTSWPDANSVHSPNDDRRSVANSDYMSPSSGAPSRSGSLPPSRHGAEPAQYNQQLSDFARFPQSGSRHASSFSVAAMRNPQERSGSIQSESHHTLGRSYHEQEQETRLTSHRPSINGFAPTFDPSQDTAIARDSYPDVQLLARADEMTLKSSGTYVPDNYGAVPSNELSAQFRTFQFNSSRSAPNGTGVRQSPFYSHQNTPPVYDHLNPYRSEQTLSHPNNFAQVQNKLANYQTQQQERRNFIAPSQLHQQQYQHILPANQLRHPYGYPFAIPGGVPLTALPPHMMGSMNPMLPMQQPPRGPRDQQSNDGLGTMSDTLLAFKREQKQNKRWELPQIYGYVVEFAGDQHGSRFIQQKLETANSEVKERVFTALQGEALQLMSDVFGNYVIQKFFEHGDQTQKKILVGKMKGHVLTLANQMYACRVVQKALEHALTDQQAAMVKELERDVLRTVKDQNGNHVIQKVIDRVPMEHIQNIVEAFRGNVGVLSVNSYGCRVIQRLLEKVPEPQRRFILTELHAEGSKLITDSYGNYVIQHVIEHGLPEDRAKIVSLIKAQFLHFSKHKFASNVVERCLVCGNDSQRNTLVSTVISKNDRGESNILNLLKDGYGNYVIQKLLETLGREDYQIFVTALKPELDKAKKIISGKQIVSVEKKMFRYERVDSPTMPPPSTPGLTSSAESEQSSELPSASTSTIEEPLLEAKLAGVTIDGVEIEHSVQ
ncbi:ARM repeat-containing protein [Plenodomus tracheiphilus IPT5]|uniref:Pumilio homology domain family member 3 n=1 Tax=Plenodomus tracheiphilus IPT5 TaxID=1408161 RepID=A0A6A7BHP7_9PLEO|nr:ARM repeat-containing protein [Plenodomus tracheiphilus IPT5]